MTKNVLLITIDSLRRDRLSEFGGEKDVAPMLNQLADTGVSFTNAFANAPGTGPSFRTLLTGTYPLSYEGLGSLDDERPKLAELLQDQGFETGGFHSNPFLSKQFNFDTGFGTFYDYQSTTMGIATKLFPDGRIHPKLQILDDVFNITENVKSLYNLINSRGRPYVSAERITDDTISWLDSVDQPFFGWAHYMDVHHPCYPPQHYRQKFNVDSVSARHVSDLYSKMISSPEDLTADDAENLRGLYDAAIQYTDENIKRLIEYLRLEDVLEDTLLIITSDHGELFGDHGKFGKPVIMYDELIHMPLLILNGPEYCEAIQDRYISFIDIPPLIHDTVGVPIPETYEGRLIREKPREFIIAEHSPRSREDKLVIAARSQDRILEYDTSEGSKQVRDVTQPEQPVLAESPPPLLEEAISDRLASIDSEELDNLETVELTEATESRLEDLGYL